MHLPSTPTGLDMDARQLVDRYLSGELEIDAYITHTFNGVENTNKAFEALHSGKCLRAVVVY
jgi:Zn-dependent alcohol dehydrogenase